MYTFDMLIFNCITIKLRKQVQYKDRILQNTCHEWMMDEIKLHDNIL